MTRRATIGIDVGTTAVKVVVADSDLEIIAEATSPTLSMDTDDSGRSEESPIQILDCVAEAINGAIDLLPSDVEIEGVAVASQSGSIVALDEAGTPHGPLITWMDSRSAGVVEGWRQLPIAHTIRSVSGWSPGTGLGLSTLAWIDATQSGRDAKIWSGVDTLVTAFLTSQIFTNPSNAAAMQLVDMTRGDWSPQLCHLAGVNPNQLPSIIVPGTVAGQLTTCAAERCGLTPAIPVVAGGHDQTCAALALDVIEPGHVLLGSGTAWVITAVAESNTYKNIAARFNVSPHVVPDRITASEYLGGLGAGYEAWVTDTYGPLIGGMPDRDLMFASAEADIVDSNERGRRAMEIMQDAAVSVCESLGRLVSSGTPPTRITLVGGATASSKWPSLIAETAGLPVTIPSDSSWPAIGAARLASAGVSIRHPIESHVEPQTQEDTP